MLRRRKMLGLAVTSRRITAIEVVPTDGGGRVTRAGVFEIPDGAGLKDPTSLGKSLKQFLRGNGFSASRCVIGMEANRMIARAKTLPSAPGGSEAKMLSLMVEREFAPDHKKLVFDYNLGTGDTDRASVLLVAAPQLVLDQFTAMAGAAGLTVTGITGSTMCLTGCGDGAADRDRIILHLFGGGAELVLLGPGGIGMMRRLPVKIPVGAGGDQLWGDGLMLRELTDELRRVVALLPGAGSADKTQRELLIWDETGLDPDDRKVLSEKLELPVRTCERPEGLELGAGSRPVPGAQFSAAAAMALSSVRGNALTIDLLHSRLSPPKRLGVGRKAAWGAALLGTLVVAGTFLVLDWREDVLEVASLTGRLNDMADDLAEAKHVIDKVNFARPWYGRRPSYLDCMREVTLAFPQEGLIWTTSVAIQEDMKVVLSGKGVSESAVLDVLDRLKANPKFSDVKPLYLRQAGREEPQVAFAMSFTFSYSGKTWSSQNAKRSSSQPR